MHPEGLNAVKFVRIDVTDTPTIQVSKEIIENAEGKIDVLMNKKMQVG